MSSEFLDRIAPAKRRALPPDEPVRALHHPDGRVFRFTTRSFDHGIELRWFVDDQFRGSQLCQVDTLKPFLDARIAELEARGWTREA
jgi:hypothetical protein